VVNDAPDPFPKGTTTVTWMVTDSSGNTASAIQKVTVQDQELPVVSAITASQLQSGAEVDVKNGANPAMLGTINISVSANDNCSGQPPSIGLVNGSGSDTATFINESPVGTFNYTWTVTLTTLNGTWTATVTATDGVNQTTQPFTINVSQAQITGQVELEGFTGGAVGHARTVTFVATDSPGANGTVLKTWTLILDNSGSGGDAVFDYTLTDAPVGTKGLSAKTNWNLRRKLSVTWYAKGQAMVDFTGDSKLRGGDIAGDSKSFRNNQVDYNDYSALVTYWYSSTSSTPAAAVADINGDGIVNFYDYSILATNWYTTGDPE
jgi:hypothetical protein